MNAAELRALAERLNHYALYQTKGEATQAMTGAAEIIDLLAWAEENKVDVQRGNYFWWSRALEDGHAGEKTLIGLLRRAREAAR